MKSKWVVVFPRNKRLCISRTAWGSFLTIQKTAWKRRACYLNKLRVFLQSRGREHWPQQHVEMWGSHALFGNVPVLVELQNLVKTDKPRPSFACLLQKPFYVLAICFGHTGLTLMLLGWKLQCQASSSYFLEAAFGFVSCCCFLQGMCDIPHKGCPLVAGCWDFHSHFLHVY